MAAQVTIGTLGVVFGADVSALVRGARTAQMQLRNVERAASNVSNRLKAAFLAVAGPAALGYMIKQSMDAVSAQKDLAERLHVTVGAVQVMQHAAAQAGLSHQELEKSAERLNRAIGTALRETTGQQADAFKRLGLSAKQLQGMDLDKRFIAISNAVKELNLSAPQTADFLGQIGIRGGRLANLFIAGAEGIAAARKELEVFGLVNTEEQAAKIEAAGDAMSVFKHAAEGIGRSLTLELSPFIVQAAADFQNLAEEAGGVQSIMRTAVDGVINFAGSVLDVGTQIKVEIKEWAEWFERTVETITSGASKIMGALGTVYPPARAANEAFKRMNANAVESSKAMTNSVVWDQDRLRKAYGGPLPSDNLREWVRKSREAADQQASEWAEAQKKRRVAHNDSVNSISSKEREAMDKKLLALRTALAGEGEALRLHNEKMDKEARDLLAKRVITQQQYNDLRLQMENDYQNKLRESLWSNIVSNYATEQEQLAYQHAQRLEKLAEFNAQQLQMIGGFEAAKAALERKYAEDYAKMMAQKYSAAAGVVESAMTHLSSVINTESKSGFNIMKAASIAIALVKGYEAVVSAWATGNATGIPGMGAALAGITAGAVAAQIAKLSSTNVGSKGNVTSGGGGGGGGGSGRGRGRNAPAAPAGPQHSMVVSGFSANEWLKGDTVRGIVKEIVKFQNDGGRVVIQ